MYTNGGNMKTQHFISTAVAVTLYLGHWSPSKAASAPNYPIAFLLLNQLSSRSAPTEAALAAQEWDRWVLASAPGVDTETPDCNGFYHSRRGRHNGFDAVIRHYKHSLGMETIQTSEYWVMVLNLRSDQQQTALQFASAMVGLTRVQWREAPQVAGYSVWRCSVDKLLKEDSQRVLSPWSNQLWANTLCVLTSEEHTLLFMEKRFPNHSGTLFPDLEIHRDWFDDLKLKNARRKKWWQFWKREEPLTFKR
jgi:hypothetical protein